MTSPNLPGLLTDEERHQLAAFDAAPRSSYSASDAIRLRRILQNVLERTGPFFDEAYRQGLEWQRKDAPRRGWQWPWGRSRE